MSATGPSRGHVYWVPCSENDYLRSELRLFDLLLIDESVRVKRMARTVNRRAGRAFESSFEGKLRTDRCVW